VRILVADDHEIVRQGLRALIETRAGFVVCGEAANGREAIDRTAALKPDVLVLDIAMPELNGLEAARRIPAVSPRTQILVLSTHHDDALVHEIVTAGVRGYVLKSDAARDLVTAIESLGSGRPFFSAQIADVVVEGFVGRGRLLPGDGGAAARLTSREREVLQLLAEGRSTKEVAASLDIGIKTAETHRANLMKKLDLQTIAELVRYAVRNHIVEP
jgi:DNA-binding NarL/FixJ family response regulator